MGPGGGEWIGQVGRRVQVADTPVGAGIWGGWSCDQHGCTGRGRPACAPENAGALPLHHHFFRHSHRGLFIRRQALRLRLGFSGHYERLSKAPRNFQPEYSRPSLGSFRKEAPQESWVYLAPSSWSQKWRGNSEWAAPHPWVQVQAPRGRWCNWISSSRGGVGVGRAPRI